MTIVSVSFFRTFVCLSLHSLPVRSQRPFDCVPGVRWGTVIEWCIVRIHLTRIRMSAHTKDSNHSVASSPSATGNLVAHVLARYMRKQAPV